MLFRQLYDEDLAQASYLIGCQATGEAVVVDPRRDVAAYLDEAAREGLRIVHVTETHIHADYLSGGLELARATGARLHLSAEGDDRWRYRFGDPRLRHGSEIRIGNVVLTALHTPGHTPEHLSFLVTDEAAADRPGFLLSGDFAFVGDVGRPDLLDEAAGFEDTRFEGARQLFASLRDRFLALPDWVQVWPGHGAGSACGKALGSVPSTTVGYERTFAWWAPYLRSGDEGGFVAALLEGQPEAPSYFGRMKRLNRDGPPPRGPLEPLPELGPDELEGLLLIDTRSADAHRAAAVPGALHVPSGKKFATYASYVLEPERDERPLALLARDAEHAGELRDRLARIGADRVDGFVRRVEGLSPRPAPTVTPAALARLRDPVVLDVRSRTEYDAGHIPGATLLHVGRLVGRLGELPRGRTLVVHCQSGARAAVAASALRAAGFEDVRELEGSYPAWREAQAARA